jgi:arylsulfatase A-like enzyme
LAVYGGAVKAGLPAPFFLSQSPISLAFPLDARMKSAFLAVALLVFCTLAAGAQESFSAARPHNVIIFVADGLRYGSVEPGNMPNMARLKKAGVDFTSSHSLYPTLTTVNASAIATGHYIGDTGDFGNTLYAGQPMDSLKGSPLATLENDAVLDEMNRKFGGNYLNETTLMAAARAKGWQTAVIGKEGPARIQDSTAAPDQTVILDDATGGKDGFALPAWFKAGMKQAFVDDKAPVMAVPNIEQEVWMTKAATRIVLPHFKESGRPFLLFFWSRDPDRSQHATRDSIGEIQPGINGPSGRAGTRDADTVLGELLDTLKKLDLDKTTDIFVTADHGFTTVSRDDNGRDLPFEFVAGDLSKALNLPMAKPGLLGADPASPEVVVASNGGTDLIYLPGANAASLAPTIVNFLAAQSYVSGIFVNDKLGRFPGALAMSDAGLIGAAKTPQPAIFVSFRSFSVCANILQCTVENNDSTYFTGQGHHGSFSRAETRNFMAAIGPDFKTGYADAAPISNADIAPTLAHIMGLALPGKGKLIGRVIWEALPGGAPVKAVRRVIASDPGAGGLRTYLDEQSVGGTRYFDAAGFEGRTVGLSGH